MVKTEYQALDETTLVRTADRDLHGKLTGKPAVDTIAAALREAVFVFEPDDAMTLADAEGLQVVDGEEYARGYDLLAELSALDDRITAHYAIFAKPLKFLSKVVRDLKNPQLQQVQPIKAALAKRIGAWKMAQDARERAERERLQAEANRKAKEEQEAKAASLERVAQTESDPQLAQSFKHEAEMVRRVPVRAAPVAVQSAVPVSAGHTRRTWTCEVEDLRTLMQAWLDGKCHLDEAAIIKGLQASLNRQATVHCEHISKAFPGTVAVPSDVGVTPRR